MRFTTHKVKKMKNRGEPIVVVTAYDATTAAIVERSGIPIILVGDSLGNVLLGYESTVPVSMDDMVRATSAVVRGTHNVLIIADMPFMAYQANIEQAMWNAGRLLKEGGAQAVKLEGGRNVAPTVRKLTDAGIPVMGHLGLTPQSIHQVGGYRVQGRKEKEASELRADAVALEAAGAFSVVLELVPSEVALSITEKLSIPTIGIGAGINCDGQVQVIHDILGLQPEFNPRHTRRYADLGHQMQNALEQYASDVRLGTFPTDAESFSLSNESHLKDPSENM